MRSIALATLANLTKTVENRSFSIHEIASRAAELFQLDYDDLSSSLATYLAGTVKSGREGSDIIGDPSSGKYALSDAGQQFQAIIAAAAAPSVPSTTSRSDDHSSVTGKRGRDQQSSSSSSSSSRPGSKHSTGNYYFRSFYYIISYTNGNTMSSYTVLLLS